jgi:hypothetical protein
MASPKGQGKSFTEQMDEKSLAAFTKAAKQGFADQAMFFLDAFWEEFGDHADVIYSVHYEHMKMADMRIRNIQYIHLYEDGADLDFDMGLYFFEQTVKFFNGEKTTPTCSDGKTWAAKYKKAVPQEQTAIVRKKELRDKVDVNFDGRVSFLEYLLYQFEASPKLLMERATTKGSDPPEVTAAKLALAEVNKRIRAYEAEKQRLQHDIDGPKGIKQLKAVNEMAQLDSSPLAEALRKDLIIAEAKVRIAVKKYGGGVDGGAGGPNMGTSWWLSKDMEQKKAKYGKKS